MVVENIAGNSGAIGTDRVAKAAPDGYTLMWAGNAAITILPSLQTLPFDPLKDLTPISTSLRMPSIMMVNNDLPVKSIAELIAHAKANPGKLSYGTPGVGTPQHIAGELFCHLAGIKMEHIPYRGANLADVMSGVVQVGIQNAGASLPLVRDGRVRGIGITSLKRSPNAPDLPTFNELGFPGFEATSWFALMGPAGLPKPIVDKVRAESLKVLADPEMKQKFAALGLDTVGSTPRGDAGRHRRRHPQVGQGDQGRQHQDGQLRHGLLALSPRRSTATRRCSGAPGWPHFPSRCWAATEPVTVRVGERIAVEKGAAANAAFSLTASPASWAEFAKPVPAVGFQSLVGMQRVGHLRVEGDMLA